MTVCDPTEKVAELYKKKVERPEPPVQEPTLLNEESIPEDDEYEPRYIEEPLY